MQLEFLWRDGQSLEEELGRHTGHAVEVIVTDNSSNIMTYKSPRQNKPARLRIHRMFLAADPNVIQALSNWISRPRSKQAAAILDAFIKDNEHLIRTSNNKRRVLLRTRGMHFNLRELFDEVNAEHFEDTINSVITWGRMPAGRRRRRSIRLGSYTPEDNLIRIHPYLDQEFVPRYFVRYIVFHEMLHAHLGIETCPNGRRKIHTPEFKRLEQAYPEYPQAIAWHDDPKNLRKLLGTM